MWLHVPFVPKGKSKKLYSPWQGPFRVVKVLSNLVYRIERLGPGRRQRCVVHFDRLKPYEGSNARTPTTAGPSRPAPVSEIPIVPSSSPSLPRPSTVTNTDEDEFYTTRPSQPCPEVRRSTRRTQPPDRYGNLVS